MLFKSVGFGSFYYGTSWTRLDRFCRAAKLIEYGECSLNSVDETLSLSLSLVQISCAMMNGESIFDQSINNDLSPPRRDEEFLIDWSPPSRQFHISDLILWFCFSSGFSWYRAWIFRFGSTTMKINPIIKHTKGKLIMVTRRYALRLTRLFT